jgi:hypothetical protein
MTSQPCNMPLFQHADATPPHNIVGFHHVITGAATKHDNQHATTSVHRYNTTPCTILLVFRLKERHVGHESHVTAAAKSAQKVVAAVQPLALITLTVNTCLAEKNICPTNSLPRLLVNNHSHTSLAAQRICLQSNCNKQSPTSRLVAITNQPPRSASCTLGHAPINHNTVRHAT